jgi:hypothetical protein
MGYQMGIIDPATEDVVEQQVNPELLEEPNAPDLLNEKISQAVIVKKFRHKGPNTRSRLLCPECGVTRQVTVVENGTVILSCGDSRTSEILPLLPGRISIESLAARDALGYRFFPVPRCDEAACRPAFEEYYPCQ